MSARDIRRQRAVIAREQASSLKALEHRLHRPLTKRERTAELRRIESKHRRDIEEARRRAEAARLAAIARQRAIDQALRNEVQSFIAKDDTSGEDPEVRRVAVSALGNHAGTVVVMDPLTGRVYSVVNQEWALHRGFKPCSTIKLVTGVAGLNEKIIPPVESAAEGARIDLTSALAHSDNPYFEQIGSRLGFDKMVTYARELGLGEKTGLNPSEIPGHLPEMKPGFVVRRMFSYADGFEVTPLQLGTLVSALANGGKLLVPQVPRNPQEGNKLGVKIRRQLDISNEVWQRMIPGMVGSVNYGSGRRAYDPTQTVAGKTGTCIGQSGWVGLFASYAPLANPRLAVVVITEGTDAHKHVPAAVAGEIYRELNHRFGTPINMQVASTLDDEEKEAGDGDDADQSGNATNGNATQADPANTIDQTATAPIVPNAKPATDNSAQNSKVRRVLMPIERRQTEPQKNVNPPPANGTRTPNVNPSPVEQRPRRAQPDQP
ncbi:MAG: penicillin-binding transpeptidase domain-containing protein [Pyrinomonadaceae bacterium]